MNSAAIIIGTGLAAAATHADLQGVTFGTAAPPATLGGYAIATFPSSPIPPGTSVPSVASPLGGKINFIPALTLRRIGLGWPSWSHGYIGDVYASDGMVSVQLLLPPGTAAFYLYAQPRPGGVHVITVVASNGGVSLPLSQSISADGGAKGWGFWTTCPDALQTVTVSTSDGSDFAVGEFGIGVCPPPCRADCTSDGTLDITDFTCFQNAFAVGDITRADCTLDGALDIQDFTCFQNQFALGCP